MQHPITDKPVLVTGATGFIASYTVKQLLELGYKVRGTVRDVTKKDAIGYLQEFPNAKENLELVEANLLSPNAFDAAAVGCEYIIHLASPYVLTVKDPQKDLVDPAVKGTIAILEAAVKVGGVKRIVITSSFAAITDEPKAGYVYSEKDWNTTSGLKRNPYYFSKVEAEKAANEFAKRDDFKQLGADLVFINPGLVIGPTFRNDVNSSVSSIQGILNGEFPAIMNLGWAIVDVRDVAKAHILALGVDLSKVEGNNRFLCVDRSISMREMVEVLKEAFPQFKYPTSSLEGTLGTWLMYGASYFQPSGTGQYLRTNLGAVPQVDNKKIKEVLGLDFIPHKQYIKDTVQDLIDKGHVKDPAKK